MYILVKDNYAVLMKEVIAEILYLTAQICSGFGFRGKAAALISRSVELSFRPGPTQYYRAAKYLRRNGQKGLAKAYLLKAMKIEPTTRKELKNKAKSYRRLGRNEEAIACYHQLAERYGSYYKGYAKAARLYRQMSEPASGGRWRMVTESWEAALEANPNNPDDWVRLGEAYLALDEPDKARAPLEQANVRLSGRPRYIVGKPIVKGLLKVKRYVPVNGEKTRRLNRAGTLLRGFFFGSRAIRTFYDLGRCYEALGEYDRSNNFYLEAIKWSFDDWVQLGGIGALHAREHRWYEALRAYATSFKFQPDRHDLPLEMGHIERRLGLFEKAETSYRVALDAGADEATCHFHLGTILEYRKQFAAAAKEYRESTQQAGNEWPRGYYRLGLVLAHARQFDEACQAFIQIDVDGENRQWLTMRLQETGNKQECKQADITQSDYWWREGFGYQSKEDWKHAARCFQAAIDREPRHCPTGQYILGYALFMQHEYQQACEAFLGIFVDRDVFTNPSGDVFNQKSPSIPVSYVHYRNNLPLQKNTVIYESYDGATIRGNPRAIFEQRSLYDPRDKWLHVWVINNPQNIPAEWKALSNVIFVAKGSQRYAAFYATAHFIINNSGYPYYVSRRNDQQILNTWHGTPLKTLGKDNRTRFNSYGGTQRNFLQASHLISPNPHTTWMLLDRYDLRRIYTGKLAETGYPRIDRTVNPNKTATARIRERLGLDRAAPVVLFAPTWRGTLNDMRLDFRRLEADLQAMQGTGAQLVFRGHYFQEQYLDSLNISCTAVPSDIDTNDLLAVVDVLVTDYSSICVDFLPRQKPIIYYAYDQEEYAAERGLYILPQEMPGTLCRDRLSLVEAVQRAVKSVQQHVRAAHDLGRFSAYDDGQATRRVIDFFFHSDTRHTIHDENDTKRFRNILIYAGAFKTNGITSALRSLIHNLDRQKLNPILTYSPRAIENNPERVNLFQHVTSGVDLLPRAGRQILTAQESRCLGDAQRQHFFRLSFMQEQTIGAAAAREFHRMAGNARFDILVDYTGYDQFQTRVFAFAQGDFRRIIYLHNDMAAEQYAKYQNLLSIFSLYHRYDALVSVSASSCEVNRQNLATAYGIDPARFVHADNVFDVDDVKQRASEPLSKIDAALFQGGGPIFMTLGRLSVEKDQAKLIRAFADVARQHANAQLLIVGDGPLHGELGQLIDSLQLVGRVHLLGLRENPLPLLDRADCFVLSSNHEGKPVTLYEALAVKTPVITTDLPGIRDLLSDGGGHVVANNQQALNEAMQAFASKQLGCSPAPDLHRYRAQALDMFYNRVLALEPETDKPKEPSAKPALIAHRGGSGHYLENSLAAFDHAITTGCDGAELDVHLTLDGAIVVHHNRVLNHQYTQKPDRSWLTQKEQQPFAELTLDDIRRYRIGRPNPETRYGAKFPDLASVEDQTIPTLQEVIELAKRRSAKFKLIIEIKSSCLFEPEGRSWQPLVDAVLAEVTRLDFVPRTIFCGFDWRALRYAKQQQPDVPIWMNTHPFDWRDGDFAAPSDLPIGEGMKKKLRAADAAGAHWYDGFRPESADDAARAVHEAGGDLWFGYHSDCYASSLRAARALKLPVAAWTVNLRDKERRGQLETLCLDALCVDYF